EEEWIRSPFYGLIQSGKTTLRRHLDATYRRGEFPILDVLQSEGATDYVAFIARVGESLRLGEGEGIAVSWSTDRPGAFTEAHIELLGGILPALTLAMTLRTTNRAARTLIATYLGSDAAQRVLAGNIVRGRADPIQAVVWASDLVGFTRISDAANASTVLA